MSAEAWIGMAAFTLTLVASLVCAAAWISGRRSKVEGKLENGINSSIQALQKSVDKLGERFDRAPCSEHAGQMAVIEQRLDVVDKRRD